ncbi:hypothetical protein Pelo_7745 [Pelomyxa schiedti]|nr:hypothetical protein Pelo_7745 [Pelomyxa schiedti]
MLARVTRNISQKALIVLRPRPRSASSPVDLQLLPSDNHSSILLHDFRQGFLKESLERLQVHYTASTAEGLASSFRNLPPSEIYSQLSKVFSEDVMFQGTWDKIQSMLLKNIPRLADGLTGVFHLLPEHLQRMLDDAVTLFLSNERIKRLNDPTYDETQRIMTQMEMTSRRHFKSVRNSPIPAHKTTSGIRCFANLNVPAWREHIESLYDAKLKTCQCGDYQRRRVAEQSLQDVVLVLKRMYAELYERAMEASLLSSDMSEAGLLVG